MNSIKHIINNIWLSKLFYFFLAASTCLHICTSSMFVMMPFVREPSLVNQNNGQNQSHIFYFYIVCMKRATFQNSGEENKEIQAYSILRVTLKSLLWTAPKQHSHGSTANTEVPQRGCNSPARRRAEQQQIPCHTLLLRRKHNFYFDLHSIFKA